MGGELVVHQQTVLHFPWAEVAVQTGFHLLAPLACRWGHAVASPFLVAQRQQHPEAESSSTGQSPSGQPRPPPTSGPAPPLPSLPHRPGLPARSARGPGVRARVPAWGCAPEPSSDPRPRPAQDRPGIPARAPRPTSPATGLQPCTRRALQEDGGIGGRQRCRRETR